MKSHLLFVQIQSCLLSVLLFFVFWLFSWPSVFRLWASIGISFFVELNFFTDKSWNPYVPLALQVQLDSFYLLSVRFTVLKKMVSCCRYTSIKCVQLQQPLFHPFIHCTLGFTSLTKASVVFLVPLFTEWPMLIKVLMSIAFYGGVLAVSSFMDEKLKRLRVGS